MQAQSIRHETSKGSTIALDFISSEIVRVRYGRPDSFADTGLNRYGFIQEDAFGDVEAECAPEGVDASTSDMRVRWDDETGTLGVGNASGETVFEMVSAEFADGGAVVRARARKDEDWVGFGDQTRDRLYHRGQVADCHVRNVKSYAPVPFFMSTVGAGVLVNTTHRIVFDMCASDPDLYEWRDGRGAVDFYVMVGDSFARLLNLYTQLTGRPKLPPEWSFGLWYICRTQANDYEATNDAAGFRREGIPCDVIGLEPGWMETNYDETLGKEWSKDRFPIPAYMQTGPHNFFNAIQRMGFHMELWLCCDYDLSFEADRRIGGETEAAADNGTAGFFQADAELDAHFSSPRYFDRVTKRDQSWFEHLEKFVDQGVAFFKQDGAYQVLDHPDRLWGNGMLDAEMHNLYPLLYARQMLEGFEAHTGRRGLTFTPCGWVGFQAWAGTWTGDTGGGLTTLGAMLNTAIVGHSWCTNDMEVAEMEALHFGYLLPWAQINSWNYFRMPWMQGEKLLEAHRFYGRLRSRLIPYIYTYAQQATQTGYPLMTPMTLAFQDDPECRELKLQYMLGRDLMVCAFEEDVYFPEGRWLDFWTGEVVEGGTRRMVSWADDRGGGLYVREGGVVPLGPVLQYRGEAPVDEVELLVFPGDESSSFELYEDDGVSFAHREGGSCTTRVTVSREDGVVVVEVAETLGAYEGMCDDRSWALRVCASDKPGRILLDGRALDEDEWLFDADRDEVCVAPCSGPCRLEIG